MNKQIAVEIFQALKPELLWLLVYSLAAGFVVLLVKSLLENLVQYRLFKGNDQIGARTKVRVRGKVGKISDYNFWWIEVLTEDGSEIIMVSMRRWQFEQWSVILDGSDSEHRRIGDK